MKNLLLVTYQIKYVIAGTRADMLGPQYHQGGFIHINKT